MVYKLYFKPGEGNEKGEKRYNIINDGDKTTAGGEGEMR